jgi:hypothetical protein
MAALGLLGWAPGAAPAEKNDKEALFHLEAPVPKTGLDFHGAVNLDFVGFEPTEQYLAGAGAQENNFMVRRARVVLTGVLYEKLTFFIQSGLESTDTLLMDAIIIYSPMSWLDFRAGQMKMPFSAERLESYLINPFVERSLAANLELRRSRGVAMALHPGQGGVRLDLGLFTGENMNKNNTDDHFEGVARGTLRLEKLISSFPGALSLSGSAARGRREPINAATTSFTGKTLNELNFFSPVNVNGYRTRYEADLSWTYKPLWIAAEWISSQEERENTAVDLDTNGDGAKDVTLTRDLKPLKEQGWKASVVYVLTGEAYNPRLVPVHQWGALELCLRYSAVTFDSQEDRIRAGAPGTFGREVSAASTGLGRRSIDEAVRSADVELNWFLKPGFWIGFDTIWQWFDHSAPYGPDHPDDHDDINYRGRVGMAF